MAFVKFEGGVFAYMYKMVETKTKCSFLRFTREYRILKERDHLLQEVNDLKQHIEELDENNDKLREEHAEELAVLSSSFSQHFDDNNNNEEIKEYQREIQKLKNSIEDKNYHINQLQRKLMKTQVEMEKDLENHEAELENLRSQLEKLENSDTESLVESRMNDLKGVYEKEIRELKARLEAEEESHNEPHKDEQLSNTMKEVDELKTKLKTLEDNMDERLEEEELKFRREVMSVKDKLIHQHQLEIDGLLSQLERSNAEVEKLRRLSRQSEHDELIHLVSNGDIAAGGVENVNGLQDDNGDSTHFELAPIQIESTEPKVVQELENIHAHYQQQFDFMHNRIHEKYQQDLDENVQKAEEEYEHQLEKQRSDYEEKIVGIQRQLRTQFQADLERVTNDMEEQIQVVKDGHVEEEEFKSRVDGLEQELRAEKEKVADYDAKLQDVDAQIQAFKAEKQQEVKYIEEEMKKQCKALVEKKTKEYNEESVRSRSELDESHRTLKDKYDNELSDIMTQMEQLEPYKDKCEDLEKENRELLQKYNKDLSELKLKMDEVDKRYSENEKMEGESLRTLEDELNLYKTKVQELEEGNQMLVVNYVERLQQENTIDKEALSQTVDELSKQLQWYMTNCLEMEESKTAVDNRYAEEIQTFKEKIRQLDKDLEYYQTKLEETRGYVSKLEEAVIEEKNNVINDLSGKINKLQETKDSGDKMEAENNQLLVETQTASEKHKKRVSEIDDELTSLRTENVKQSKELDRVKESQYVQEIASLLAEMERVQNSKHSHKDVDNSYSSEENSFNKQDDANNSHHEKELEVLKEELEEQIARKREQLAQEAATKRQKLKEEYESKLRVIYEELKKDIERVKQMEEKLRDKLVWTENTLNEKVQELAKATENIKSLEEQLKTINEENDKQELESDKAERDKRIQEATLRNERLQKDLQNMDKAKETKKMLRRKEKDMEDKQSQFVLLESELKNEKDTRITLKQKVGELEEQLESIERVKAKADLYKEKEEGKINSVEEELNLEKKKSTELEKELAVFKDTDGTIVQRMEQMKLELSEEHDRNNKLLKQKYDTILSRKEEENRVRTEEFEAEIVTLKEAFDSERKDLNEKRLQVTNQSHSQTIKVEELSLQNSFQVELQEGFQTELRTTMEEQEREHKRELERVNAVLQEKANNMEGIASTTNDDLLASLRNDNKGLEDEVQRLKDVIREKDSARQEDIDLVTSELEKRFQERQDEMSKRHSEELDGLMMRLETLVHQESDSKALTRSHMEEINSLMKVTRESLLNMLHDLRSSKRQQEEDIQVHIREIEKMIEDIRSKIKLWKLHEKHASVEQKLAQQMASLSTQTSPRDEVKSKLYQNLLEDNLRKEKEHLLSKRQQLSEKDKQEMELSTERYELEKKWRDRLRMKEMELKQEQIDIQQRLPQGPYEVERSGPTSHYHSRGLPKRDLGFKLLPNEVPGTRYRNGLEHSSDEEIDSSMGFSNHVDVISSDTEDSSERSRHEDGGYPRSSTAIPGEEHEWLSRNGSMNLSQMSTILPTLLKDFTKGREVKIDYRSPLKYRDSTTPEPISRTDYKNKTPSSVDRVDQDDDFSLTEIDRDLFLCKEKYYTSWNVANIWVVRGTAMDLVIDTGIGLWDLPGFLKEKRLIGDKPYQAVATHIHFDHSGGLHQFKEFAIHRAEAEAIRTGDCYEAVCLMGRCDIAKPPSENWSTSDYKVLAAEPTRVLEDGDIFDLGDKKIRVLHLPGHSRGSIALYDEANRNLFSGDIIYDGPLLDSLPYGSVAQNIESFETLVALTPNVDRVFPVVACSYGFCLSSMDGEFLELVKTTRVIEVDVRRHRLVWFVADQSFFFQETRQIPQPYTCIDDEIHGRTSNDPNVRHVPTGVVLLFAQKQIAVDFGQMIKEDLEEAYFFPAFPSSYCTNSRFYNSTEYQLYDYPPNSLTYNEIFYPRGNFCTAGDEIPVLTDHPPPEFLTQHWKTWLADFPLAKFISIDDGLKDDNIPIVTCSAFQGIPRNKHSIDPDILYKLQLKSSIPEIGVPCPRHMDEKNVEFPCVVKVDLSYSGFGTLSAKSEKELSALVKQVREEHGWRGKIVYQEFIRGVKQVPSYHFYLKKSGEVVWMGTNMAIFHGFQWKSLTCDWNKQDEERNLVYDEFVIPIKDYLHKHGYFGFVDFELVVNDHGRYLVDLNTRLPGDTMHQLMAPYMAGMGFAHSILESISPTRKTSAQKLVEDANQLNQTDNGRIVVVSVADVGDDECKQAHFIVTVIL
ncbi:hypothetical protein QZH41_007132 [Actinostola sp. cb2023]|nr:hypothetical protein QZH41_007132 [Actinostola sp. cb2023]